MKRLSVILVLFATVTFLSAGMVFAQSSIPDLKGKWKTKSYGHHHEKRGFFTNAEANGIWVVKEQQGRYFSGDRTYVMKQISNENVTEGFSGVISKDGKRVYLVDHDEDFLMGDILSSDSIELIIINEPEKSIENHHSSIGLIEIERVK
jgi:hypothetical protein